MSMSGSWSAAELPHRVSQKYVERVLRRHAEALPGVSIEYGWRVTGFADTYEALLALVRPDQVVAWRGFDDADADAVVPVTVGRSGVQP
jgi:hypothetical protein